MGRSEWYARDGVFESRLRAALHISHLGERLAGGACKRSPALRTVAQPARFLACVLSIRACCLEASSCARQRVSARRRREQRFREAPSPLGGTVYDPHVNE